MEAFREFVKDEERVNWIKCTVGLWCLQKLLEPFVDEQLDSFHEELGKICGPQQCDKKCHFQNWKPQPNQIPPLDCTVCSRWIEEIHAYHTNPRGRVYWKNSEPHLWSKNKWEVAKVFMTSGHKNHKSLGDFDIAALLCLITQCKYFKRFELGDLCTQVSTVRNNIMHTPHYMLKKEDLHSYLHQIRALGEELAKHDPRFKRLSKDMDEIPNLDVRLDVSDNEASQEIQEDVEHNHTRMEQDGHDRDMSQRQQQNSNVDPERIAMMLTRLGDDIGQSADFESALQELKLSAGRQDGPRTFRLLLRDVAMGVLRMFSVQRT
ncbi:uncharacterized protein ABDE67_009695 [Symphorus nematophorus]